MTDSWSAAGVWRCALAPRGARAAGHGRSRHGLIKQFLDTGAQTLLVPMVDTAEQAAQVAAACRYPPDGVRGMGRALARASRWRAHPRSVHEASAQICCH